MKGRSSSLTQKVKFTYPETSALNIMSWELVEVWTSRKILVMIFYLCLSVCLSVCVFVCIPSETILVHTNTSIELGSLEKQPSVQYKNEPFSEWDMKAKNVVWENGFIYTSDHFQPTHQNRSSFINICTEDNTTTTNNNNSNTWDR
mgnify:CR=1 FL=1